MSDPAELAREAERILAERRFHPRRTPAPFRGVLRWLGDRLEPLGDVLDWMLSPLFSAFDAVWATLGGKLAIGVLLVIAAVALAQGIARRRTVFAFARGEATKAGTLDDPRALAAAAADAETRGEFDLALRLRFRAGIVELERTGRVARASHRTTRSIARELKAEPFDVIGPAFDAVAYGQRHATADDVAVVRKAWNELLESRS